MMKSGVYRIRNQNNGKCYIGSGVDIKSRWHYHRSDLNNNRHDSPKLQNAWNKYGIESFLFEVILYCDPENCLMYEQIALDHYQPAYNVRKIATSNLGIRWSKETRERMSRAQSGKKNARYGIKMSNELKLKISQARTGLSTGESNPSSKLTVEQILQIRSMTISSQEIAKLFSVNASTIRRIRRKDIWKTV